MFLLAIKMVDLECSKLIPICPIYPKFVDFWSVQIQKFRIFLSGRFPNEWFKSLIWLAQCRPIRIIWEPFSVPSMIISISTFWFQPMKAWCCLQWQSRAQTQIRARWWVTWPPIQLSKWTRDGVCCRTKAHCHTVHRQQPTHFSILKLNFVHFHWFTKTAHCQLSLAPPVAQFYSFHPFRIDQ